MSRVHVIGAAGFAGAQLAALLHAHPFFELGEITAQLPEGFFLHACIGCAWGDYSPLGNGSFGGMFCFRDQRAAYAAAETKDASLPLVEACDRVVQETYVCGRFQRRTPGTGYRG